MNRGAMDVDLLRLSEALVATMRRAVDAAVAADAAYVAPAHLLLALLGEDEIAAAVGELVARDELLDAARRPGLPGLRELPEGELAEGEAPPFPRYDALAWRSSDGTRTRYCDADASRVFFEGVRWTDGAPYLPRHLARGYAALAQKEHELIALLGRRAQDVRDAIAALA